MKQSRLILPLICALACTLITGCKKKNSGVWDDDATAGNYKGHASGLWGQDEIAQDEEFFGPSHEDFIGLKEEDLLASASDTAIPQPRHSPGEQNSGLPSIEGFHDPKGEEASVFKTVFFNTDDHILRGKESQAILNKIASYLKSHSHLYLFIAGHCDERGPEAYNLSLGTRRANYIRSALTEKGVDPERIHTISYGKERPADLGHNPEAWNHNRRGEFKLFQK